MHHFRVDGCLGNLWFGAIENNTPRMVLSTSFGEDVYISFEHIHQNGIIRSQCRHKLNVSIYIKWLAQWLYKITATLEMDEEQIVLYLCQHLVFFFLYSNSWLVESIYISFKMNKVIFQIFTSHFDILFGKHNYQIFYLLACPYVIDIWIFFIQCTYKLITFYPTLKLALMISLNMV